MLNKFLSITPEHITASLIVSGAAYKLEDVNVILSNITYILQGIAICIAIYKGLNITQIKKINELFKKKK